MTGTYAGQPATRDLTVRVRTDNRPRRVQGGRGDDTVEAPERAGHPDSDSSSYWSYDEAGWANVRVPGTNPRQTVTVQLSQ